MPKILDVWARVKGDLTLLLLSKVVNYTEVSPCALESFPMHIYVIRALESLRFRILIPIKHWVTFGIPTFGMRRGSNNTNEVHLLMTLW